MCKYMTFNFHFFPKKPITFNKLDRGHYLANRVHSWMRFQKRKNE